MWIIRFEISISIAKLDEARRQAQYAILFIFSLSRRALSQNCGKTCNREFIYKPVAYFDVKIFFTNGLVSKKPANVHKQNGFELRTTKNMKAEEILLHNFVINEKSLLSFNLMVLYWMWWALSMGIAETRKREWEICMTTGPKLLFFLCLISIACRFYSIAHSPGAVPI